MQTTNLGYPSTFYSEEEHNARKCNQPDCKHQRSPWNGRWWRSLWHFVHKVLIKYVLHSGFASPTTFYQDSRGGGKTLVPRLN